MSLLKALTGSPPGALCGTTRAHRPLPFQHLGGLGRRVYLHGGHGALTHVDDPVRDGRESAVVGDDHHRATRLAAGVLQKLQNGLARLVVERTGGLVAQ